jgi:hypothetical protein
MPDYPNVSDVPEVNIEEDVPLEYESANDDDIEHIKQKHAEAREDAKTQHALSKDTWVTIAGLILILILLTGSGIISWVSSEKPYVTAFLNLLSSSIMLIMGYIFGTRNNQ